MVRNLNEVAVRRRPSKQEEMEKHTWVMNLVSKSGRYYLLTEDKPPGGFYKLPSSCVGGLWLPATASALPRGWRGSRRGGWAAEVAGLG